MPTPDDQIQPIALVLASASPRRRDLLGQLGLRFSVHKADLDETPRPHEPPRAYVGRVAREKANAVAERRKGTLVLAADTSVILGDDILGKPSGAEEATAMLKRLSDVEHRVFTAVALAGLSTAERLVETTVRFRRLSDAEIAWYVGTGEPLDKAGGYAIQGIGGMLVQSIDGSPTNVIGLPLPETLELLTAAGLQLPWSSGTP